MKSVFKISLLAAVIAFSAGCQQEENANKNATVASNAEVQAVAITENQKTSTFTTDDQKASYAIGASLAQYLKSNIEQQKEFGVELDSSLVLQGVQDVFVDKGLMTEEQTQESLQALDKRISDLMQKQNDEKALAAKKAGDEYRKTFSEKKDVSTTKSGLMYIVNKMGDGKKPVAEDTVVVHYKGTLTDGTQFDSSYERNQPATFPLNRVIPGWTEGVQLMPVGSKFTFVIPPELAYGQQNTPEIPANSTLVFEVELLDIQTNEKTKEPEKSNG